MRSVKKYDYVSVIYYVEYNAINFVILSQLINSVINNIFPRVFNYQVFNTKFSYPKFPRALLDTHEFSLFFTVESILLENSE